MTPAEKLALAKAAIRTLRRPAYTGLRWTDDSWDYALFEKRLKVGVVLEERPLDPAIAGFAVVRDDDTVESFASRLSGVLVDAGLDGRTRKARDFHRRSRDEQDDE